MTDACQAAIDAGIFYDTEFAYYVVQRMGGYDSDAMRGSSQR